MYHIIFSYNSTIIKLSKSTVTSNLINQYWEDTDPGYVDWSTKKLKLGDVVKYINDEGTKKTIGTVSASTIATRVTLTSTISDDVVDDFTTKPYNVFIERTLLTEDYVYSYPINTFVGSAAYNNTTLSLFFERTAGMIDEVRLIIDEGEHLPILIFLNKEFRETKNNDIILGSEGKNTRDIPYVVGVDKVLTSISTNRN